jgi:hypothetical protein
MEEKGRQREERGRYKGELKIWRREGDIEERRIYRGE